MPQALSPQSDGSIIEASYAQLHSITLHHVSFTHLIPSKSNIFSLLLDGKLSHEMLLWSDIAMARQGISGKLHMTKTTHIFHGRDAIISDETAMMQLCCTY